MTYYRNSVQINQKYERLTVIEGPFRDGKNTRWLCLCECGKTPKIRQSYLLDGTTKSCGCWIRDYSTLHKETRTPLHRAWVSLKQRCYNKNNKEYKYYGARGIKVCDRWLESYENFKNDMGPHPGQGLSLDRKNNDRDYEPNNCRWATSTQQNSNKRNNRWVFTPRGQLLLTDAINYYQLNRTTVFNRLKNGELIEHIFTKNHLVITKRNSL